MALRHDLQNPDTLFESVVRNSRPRCINVWLSVLQLENGYRLSAIYGQGYRFEAVGKPRPDAVAKEVE